MASGFQHATAHLVQLHGFEQSLEVAFAETFVALALNELEKDRTQLVLAEDLQQQLARGAIHQDVALAQRLQVFAVAGNALVEQLVVGVAGGQQRHATQLQCVHRVVQVVAGQRNVLDALAVVAVQILLDLPGLVVALFVDRDADLAAGAGHGLALDAGLLAFKVEVAHLAEIEKSLVKARPLAHAAAVHVVRQVVDHRHAIASGVQLGTRQGFESRRRRSRCCRCRRLWHRSCRASGR
jgi:hypothetical protein